MPIIATWGPISLLGGMVCCHVVHSSIVMIFRFNYQWTWLDYQPLVSKDARVGKGRTIRKVMGGVGKKPKKYSCKGKCQEKKFVQRGW